MTTFHYPLEFFLKITTLANDFTVTDSYGNQLSYVRQKMLKLIEEVVVYTNDSKSEVAYRMKANKWIDFSATFVISNSQGVELGRIVRKGWASIWKARYEIYDRNQNKLFLIKEDNAWIKLIDSLIGEIPVLNFFTGYLFNPTYSLINMSEISLMQLKKESSFFGRRFKLLKINQMDNNHEEVAVLAWMMMVLLERRRG